MKRWAAGMVVAAAMLAPAAPAGASTSAAEKACGPKGTAATCKAYLYDQCVIAAKKHGLSSSEAKVVCGG